MSGITETGENQTLQHLEEKPVSLKHFIEQAKDLVSSDVGPPHWFSPLDCGHPLQDSPLLLFLPGIDGTGLGLIKHHQKLGKIFEVLCLHIPPTDRTPFTDLVKLVERKICSEHHRSPNRPIYLVGESLGACLALSVASLNPDIDLVLLLANPATSFSRSPLRPILPLLQLMPNLLTNLGLPHVLNSMAGLLCVNHLLVLRVRKYDTEKGNFITTTVEQKSGFHLSREPTDIRCHRVYSKFVILIKLVLADILPIETLLWKLQMINSASSYANSRLHAVKAQTLILSSGRDPLLPSQEEGLRLRQMLAYCEFRTFEDCGHFLFLEDSFDLATVIKQVGIYRRSKEHDFVSDYIAPSPSELKSFQDKYRWINIMNPVILSTLGDGKLVRGFAGIPSEGPVLYVGNHMLLGFDIIPLMTQFSELNDIILKGLAHPMMFMKQQKFDAPFTDDMRLMGAVPVSGKYFFKLLSNKSHILLYPGGVREALHRKGEAYKLFWPEQSEFVRMAARFGAKIIPFGAVGEDDWSELIFDYEDQMKVPFLRKYIDEISNESGKLRATIDGEEGNQAVYFPVLLPKFPGRFYYRFGKPIETEGIKEELRDRNKTHELYLQVKSEVESCMAYLQEKRESDPYRSLASRLVFHARHGFTSQVPTFDIE
ncbi:phytyl ester synthase 2, chloroplastic-like [Argentina anserina]|uniref:phytyl ester synthase 2, chloroplastic-like n=1 Tax=Argentina anserina TaxID=57926 RepID=UPI0021766DF1|nr:phytyl ester synthase 2, chloroplastic-like [Potentilla anserina]